MNQANAPMAPGLWIWLAAIFSGCTIAAVACAAQAPPAEKGMASVYSDKLNGKKTASGERYDSGALTAAHRTLPLGAELRVTNLENGKSVRVLVNDRGPHVQGRIVDLSASAAAALGMHSGVARVKLEILSQPEPAATGPRSRP